MKKVLTVVFAIFALWSFAIAQDKTPADTAKVKGPYQFTLDYEIPHTPVKSQARTGTCWCFSTVSFLESEMLRTGKKETDLSEMFIVRKTYPLKAEYYIRLHGNSTFGEGAYSHDVINQMRRYGMVPESVYNGMNIGEKKHNHSEMSRVLTAMLNAIKKGRKLTPRWKQAFEDVLDDYLGQAPEKFKYEGKEYTPKTFLKDYMQLNPDDYVEVTSFTHHPFYSKFDLEVPDNWCHEKVYNVPINDLERIVDASLKNGYSLVWGGDVSDRFFKASKEGYAIVPAKDWEDMTKKEREKKITEPVKEKIITQEMRQKAFDNYSTTDDHAMHMVGLAHNQTGAKFYYIKNSWGKDMKYGGYFYMSKPYMLLRCVAIMVNKNAIPEDIKNKLNIR
ncbi:aminopeptidase [candidate division KSB1 bacterium]|nr:MAG: aminopeptidase [candidate division KSB1 bacterium]